MQSHRIIKKKNKNHDVYSNDGFDIFHCDSYIRNVTWCIIIFTYVQNVDVFHWNDRAYAYYYYNNVLRSV